MELQEAMEILLNGKRGDVVREVETRHGQITIKRTKTGYAFRRDERPDVVRDILKDRREQLQRGIGS